MKSLIPALAFLWLTVSVAAQEKDIEVFEKKDGNKNIVIARNVGKVSYLVTINITAKGMDVLPSAKVEGVVPPGYMKEMATLQARPGEAWSYGYEVSFIEYAGEMPKASSASSNSTKPIPPPSPEPPSVANADPFTASIVVYTQAGCGRCSFVKKEMKAKGIPFEEVDVNGGSTQVNDMWMQLRNSGFTGESVTMPVVIAHGELYYNIKDLAGFVNDLKM
jgi:glutaredoxin